MEKLNKIQEEASINLKNNIVLNAAAGTGKTRVLTSRFINSLKEISNLGPEAYEKILAITFTNKAAAEMKEKIKKDLLASEDQDLKNLARYFSKANIFTIHGFCKDYIEKNAMKYGLSLDFEVADSNLTDAILFDAIDDSLEIYKNDSRLYDYLKITENYNLDNLRSSLFELYQEMKNKSLTINDIRAKNADFILGKDKKDLVKLINLLEEYANLDPGKKFTNFYKTQEFADFLKEPNYDFLDRIGRNLGSVKREEVLNLRNKIKEELDDIAISFEVENQIFYDFILEIFEKVIEKYSNYKKDANVFDYSDLEDQALNILSQEENFQYKYILVDEFQDTNKLQVQILKYLTKNLSSDINLFVVGDPKQSIYGFRGGDLETYKSFTNQMIEESAIRLEMTENYRSSKKLIESFNEIFTKLLEDDYSPIDANIAGEEKIKILTCEEDQNIGLANKIKNLVESEIKEEDIAVLFRTNKEIAPVKKELIKRGLGVNDSSNKFEDENEISDLLIILKAIKNKKDIINILAYLKSPYVGLDENSIFKLALYYKENNLLDHEPSENLAEPYKSLYLEAIENLEYFRNYNKYYSISDLIIKILEKLNYYQISLIENGENSLINIDKLIKAAKEYEIMSMKKYMSFTEYIENLSIEDENDKKGVKLMTIHKSKGLEFKIVFLANSGKAIRSKAMSKLAVGDIGLGLDLKKSKSKHSIIKEEKNKKENEEELRLLYVAMTRAREELFLGVNLKDDEIDIENASYLSFLKDLGFHDYEIIEADEKEDKNLEIFQIPNLGGSELASNYEILDNFTEADHYIENKIEKNKIIKYYTPTDFLYYLYDKENFFKSHFLGYQDKDLTENGLKTGIKYEIDPIILGNIVHKYAEISPENIDSFIDSQFDIYDINKDRARQLIKKHIGSYEKLNKGEILSREEEFFYKFKTSIVRGKIDQLRKVNGEYQLIDIKTGNLNDQAKDLYKYQIHIYLAAIEKLRGIKISSAFLLSTLDEKEYEIDISREEVEKSLEKFSDFILDVESYKI